MTEQPAPTLRIDWCSHDAAKFAVMHWHYSRTMPAGKIAKIGAWENDRFIGCVLFSWGASAKLAQSFGLDIPECVELVRVALDQHHAPVTQIVARAIRMLHEHSPGVRLIVSFADPNVGHHGGIYQAGNWIFAGTSQPSEAIRLPTGQIVHRRPYVGRNFTSPRMPFPKDAVWVKQAGKFRYLMPLDRAMRRQCESLRQQPPGPLATALP